MSLLSQLSVEDRDHFKAVCAAFFNYQVDSMLDLLHMERDFPAAQLSGQSDQLKSAVYTNYFFLSRCVHGNRALFPCKTLPNGSYIVPNLRVKQREVRQVRAALKQCARDWSEAGAEEREETYAFVIEEVQRHFPRPRLSNGGKIRILIPAAGLGRLVFEFARLGYSAQGSESSYFQLLVSDFLLNKTKRRNEFLLYPFAHLLTSNTADTLRQVTVPDLCPAEQLSMQDDLCMVGGDFGRGYNSSWSEWDCVATCLGSECEVNVLNYVDTIWKIIKPGGIWVHFSPVRCHFTDRRTNASLDVTYTDLRQAIQTRGFHLLKEEIKDSRCTQEKWALQVACKRSGPSKKS